MSYVKSLELPRVGEPIDSARVVHWNVQPGEQFADGDILLEIDTDKAVLEVPAEESGKLLEHLVKVDDVIESDTPIARVEVAGTAPATEAVSEPEPEPEPEPVREPAAPTGTTSEPPASSGGEAPCVGSSGVAAPSAPATVSAARVFATPVARRLAEERGLELSCIEGHGPRGRVTRADVLRASEQTARASVGIRGPTQPAVDEWTVTTAHGELFVRSWTPMSSAAAATVVLVHGMFADIDAWQGTARSACRAGCHVIAMDLPCHGQSRSGATRFEDVVEAVAEVTARVSAGPVILVGHSFGGAVVARVARKPDLEVDGLVLIAPIGLGTDINQSFLTGMAHAGSVAALEREMRKLTTSGATPSGEYLETLRRRLEAQSEALTLLAREVSWSGVQQLDITSDLAALECPITIVHGRSDAIVPWEHVLNAPARAALHLVPGAGHMPQWEATALMGELIERATGQP